MDKDDRPTVRTARHGDESEIRWCVDTAYSPYVALIGKPPAPMLDDYERLVKAGVVRVSTRAGRIEGVIVMWPEDDHLYVDNIAVRADAQAAGVGTALLAEADHEAALMGRVEIRLYTNAAMTSNIHYYARRGFVETHRGLDCGYERVYFSRRLSPPIAS